MYNQQSGQPRTRRSRSSRHTGNADPSQRQTVASRQKTNEEFSAQRVVLTKPVRSGQRYPSYDQQRYNRQRVDPYNTAYDYRQPYNNRIASDGREARGPTKTSTRTRQILLCAGLLLLFPLAMVIKQPLLFFGYAILTVFGIAYLWRITKGALPHVMFTIVGIFLIVISLLGGFSFSTRDASDIGVEKASSRSQGDSVEARDVYISPVPTAVRTPAVVVTPSPEEIKAGGYTHDGVANKMILYYYGSSNYHADPNCSIVNEKYRPLTEVVLYKQLTDWKFKNMQPCKSCRAPTRPHTH